MLFGSRLSLDDARRSFAKRAPHGSFDAVFVNAGATHPRLEWLVALKPGGRLVIPLTVGMPRASPGSMGRTFRRLHRAMARSWSPRSAHGLGVMICVERRNGKWPARLVSQTGIFHCANARDPANEAELEGLLRGGMPALRVVDRELHDRSEGCIAHLPGFCLQR